MAGAELNLRGVDLNLLVVLDALLREASVTRAARRLGLSQSATSHALGRLRSLIGDPLLVRASSGMVHTARALGLLAPVRAILEQAEQALLPPTPFDPAESRARFTLGLDDATQVGTLPSLAALLQTLAPCVELRARAEAPSALLSSLSSGELDLAVTVAGDLPDSAYAIPLLTYRHVCVVRPGHPRIAGRLSISRYLAEAHVVIATAESVDITVDRLLAERGHERHVAITASSPLAVPTLVAKTDLIATVPDRLLSVAEPSLKLVALPVPLALPPVTVSMVWHARTHHDPAQRWMRDTIRELYANAERRRAGRARA